MRNGADRLLVILLVALAAVSCERKPFMRSRAYASVNLTNLVGECQQLAGEWIQKDKQTWDHADPLPPTIHSLSPQIMKLENQGWGKYPGVAKVMNIQITGGFEHKGVLVICQTTDPGFVPYAGRDWRVTKIAEGIFEYRE
jgi:hypothetical protein